MSPSRIAWGLGGACLVVIGAACSRPAVPVADPVTVLFDDQVTTLAMTLPSPTDLWVDPVDLPSVNGFELKPQGACLDELCIPIRQEEDSDLFITRSGQGWFNVTELARKLEQPFVVDRDADRDHVVWSLGDIPVSQSAMARTRMAPDFSLPNQNGDMVSLSDYRGKKVLILTWASW